MRILAIETSCDETAVALIEANGTLEDATFKILGDALYSQAKLHAKYGGVFPALAKREHQKNLTVLTKDALQQAGMLNEGKSNPHEAALQEMRDQSFRDDTRTFLEEYAKPSIDLIVVTRGPGLEPALWTGITFATALAKTWNIPILGVDHMEGHIVSATLEEGPTKEYRMQPIEFPALALLMSGGHTQLVSIKEWFSYEHVGETRDDAVGEAFDKVARLLDLEYPGGPRVAELATRARERLTGGEHNQNPIIFPRPMAADMSCDFSFSGLKTAVLYKLKSMEKISETDKENIAEAFENAVRDVITIKTKRALKQTGAKTLMVGGGVSANVEIGSALSKMLAHDFPTLQMRTPQVKLTGDNAIMIGAAGYLRSITGHTEEKTLTALGGLRLGYI